MGTKTEGGETLFKSANLIHGGFSNHPDNCFHNTTKQSR